jgi:hypothetical protein
MISMARTLGAPRERAGREAGAQRVDGGQLRLEPALDRAHDVHHVRVALDEHQLVTFTLPNWLTRPTSLRPRSTSITCSARSFLVVEHLVGQRLVFGLGRAARARSGDGPVLHLALVHAHQQLRRRPASSKGAALLTFFGFFGCPGARPAVPPAQSAGKNIYGLGFTVRSAR